MIEGDVTPVERTASLVALPNAGIALNRSEPYGSVYRCDECMALLADADSARTHLHWHDRIAYAVFEDS